MKPAARTNLGLAVAHGLMLLVCLTLAIGSPLVMDQGWEGPAFSLFFLVVASLGAWGVWINGRAYLRLR